MTRTRCRGGSLLEVLAAMSLFALVASGTAKLAVGSMRQTVQNRHGTAAAMLAQKRLEELRGLSYAEMLPGSTSTTVDGLVYVVATSVLQDTPAPGMKQLTVTVSWTGPGGAKSYAVQTIFTAVTT